MASASGGGFVTRGGLMREVTPGCRGAAVREASVCWNASAIVNAAAICVMLEMTSDISH